MRAAIDANIALAQFLELPYAKQARDQLDGITEILAPSLIFSETSNALWRLAKAGHLKLGYAADVLDAVSRLVAESCDDRLLMQDALRHAMALDHPVYDLFYLSLAIRADVPLLTADTKFFRKLQGTSYQSTIVLVSS